MWLLYCIWELQQFVLNAHTPSLEQCTSLPASSAAFNIAKTIEGSNYRFLTFLKDRVLDGVSLEHSVLNYWPMRIPIAQNRW